MARGQFSRKDYLTCSLGKWRQKVSETHPNRQERVNKDGNLVYELVYDFASGILRKITVESHEEFGKKWALQIHDQQEVMVLQVPFSSGYAGAMISKLLNCDLKKSITFIPYYFEEEKRSRMVLKQEDRKIPNMYTKENPGDFPQFPTSGDKDDLALWKMEVNRFLVDKVDSVIRPQLPKEEELATEQALDEATAKPGEHLDGPPEDNSGFPDGPDNSDDNDLPF